MPMYETRSTDHVMYKKEVQSMRKINQCNAKKYIVKIREHV